jgi:protein-S-isoprenylcysteine O-methyltransferase Ste14
MTNQTTNWKFMIISYLITLLFITQIILSIFFYNWAGIDLLTYIGWITLAVGIIILYKSQKDFKTIGKRAEGKNWLDTTNIIDSGVYSIIRHPMYLAFILTAIALIFISQYWLNIIIGIIRIVLLYYVILEEEKGDLEKFGQDYKDYMKRVPRLNFIKGILKRE